MKAEILSIGTELLLGNIVNTNSRYLAEECSLLGIGIYRITEVGDNPQRLRAVYRECLERSDLIIATGGLGPTRDDLSKEMAVEVLGQTSVLHEPTQKKLQRTFQHNEERIGYNLKQAYFPENAVVLENPHGTAPGCILFSGDKRIVLLPGPPHEMEVVFEGFKAWWERHEEKSTIRSRVLRLAGIGESDAAHRLGDLLDSENPSLAPYAKPYEVTLRLTGRGNSEIEVASMLDALEEKVRAVLGSYIYGADEDSLEQTVLRLVKQRNATIATAESLTGGLVAANLVNVPGASDVFHAGVIAYSDEEKILRLNVSRETIQKHTAVSEETCREMTAGLHAATGAEVCVATTGYAGPDGPDVGLVYIGVLVDGKIIATEHRFSGARHQIRNRSARMALTEVWRRLR